MNNYQLCDISLEQAEMDAATARMAGTQILMGGLVVNPHRQIFAQRRSLTRKFGPGLWDNVGGHVEGNETLYQTLAREITEETGWTLNLIQRIIAIRQWQNDQGISREYIALCRVTGNLEHPELEHEKVDQSIWVDHTNLKQLNENRVNDLSQSEIYQHGLKLIS